MGTTVSRNIYARFAVEYCGKKKNVYVRANASGPPESEVYDNFEEPGNIKWTWAESDRDPL